MNGKDQNWHHSEWYNDGLNKIHKTALISDNVIMGKGNIILPFAVIGYPGMIRDYKLNDYKGKVSIGSNNTIGAYANIMCGVDGITQIGSNNIIMNHCNIGHNVTIGNDNEIGAGTIVGGHAIIGDNNKIKLHCSIRNRVQIRDNNFIGMGSNLVKDLGHNFTVMGNPAK